MWITEQFSLCIKVTSHLSTKNIFCILTHFTPLLATLIDGIIILYGSNTEPLLFMTMCLPWCIIISSRPQCYSASSHHDFNGTHHHFDMATTYCYFILLEMYWNESYFHPSSWLCICSWIQCCFISLWHHWIKSPAKHMVIMVKKFI